MTEIKLGATGEFPKGKLCDTDEGGINVAIGTNKDNNRIIIVFGEPTSWIGMTKKEAVKLANDLLKRSEDLKEE